jgi:type IV pilus assembly protein PilB
MSNQPIDLFRRQIPREVIDLIPASVAREGGVIPIAEDGGQIVVARADDDRDTIEKLMFILNRQVTVVEATHAAIRFALEKYYPDS